MLAVCAAVACSGAERTPPCAPNAMRCHNGTVEVCSVGVWVDEIDCPEHNARCSLEPDGEAVCVVDGGAP